MSYIPSKAMPHAKVNEPQAGAPAWRDRLDTLRAQAGDLYATVRSRPLELAGAGAVLVLSLATAGWVRRRSRGHA